MGLMLRKVSNRYSHREISLLGNGFFSFGSDFEVEGLEAIGLSEGVTAYANQSN